MFVASPAQADHANCAWPWVCLWDIRVEPDLKMQYEDLGRQRLAASNIVDHVYNTRRDDSVLLWDVATNPDTRTCILPNTRVNLVDRGWHNRADRIEIRDQATCP
jgi:hypothetical protein